jgi:hypothetical protein
MRRPKITTQHPLHNQKELFKGNENRKRLTMHLRLLKVAVVALVPVLLRYLT